MKFTGTYEFEAPAQKVWEALINPVSLAGCIPGCQDMEAINEDEYKANLTVGVGPVRGRYTATITIRDKTPFEEFRLGVEGTGAVGFVSGEATITLTERDGTTSVNVDSDAQVGGTVARVGQRLMDSVGKMMMDNFFGCLRESVK